MPFAVVSERLFFEIKLFVGQGKGQFPAEHDGGGDHLALGAITAYRRACRADPSDGTLFYRVAEPVDQSSRLLAWH